MNMQKVAFVAAVVVAAGTFALGTWNFNTIVGLMRGTARTVAQAAPSGGGSVGTPAQAAQCRENLQRINAGKRRAAQDRGNEVGDIGWPATIRAMYPNDSRAKNPGNVELLMPKCPCGGIYTLGTLQEVPKCNIGGNNTMPTNDDHMIRN